MANYFVISRAKPKPGYAATGLKHLKTLADFTKENGAVHCDVGVQQTGANAGSLIAAMFVEKMATIENIFDHFPNQEFYKEMFSTGNMEITGRAIGRIHHRESGSSDTVSYTHLTLPTSPKV